MFSPFDFDYLTIASQLQVDAYDIDYYYDEKYLENMLRCDLKRDHELAVMRDPLIGAEELSSESDYFDNLQIVDYENSGFTFQDFRDCFKNECGFDGDQFGKLLNKCDNDMKKQCLIEDFALLLRWQSDVSLSYWDKKIQREDEHEKQFEKRIESGLDDDTQDEFDKMNKIMEKICKEEWYIEMNKIKNNANKLLQFRKHQVYTK